MCHSKIFPTSKSNPDFEIGKGLRLILLFNSLKSKMNLTDPSFLGMMKAGTAHSELFTFLSTPSSHNWAISFLNCSSLFYWYGKGSGMVWLA